MAQTSVVHGCSVADVGGARLFYAVDVGAAPLFYAVDAGAAPRSMAQASVRTAVLLRVQQNSSYNLCFAKCTRSLSIYRDRIARRRERQAGADDDGGLWRG